MKVAAVKTDLVRAGDDLWALLDAAIKNLANGSVIAVTSKIVALAENRLVPFDKASKEELIERESDYYLPKELSKYSHHFTITRGRIVGGAGIDNSNGGGYVLWPSDAQKSANDIRKYLADKYGLKQFGVIITDSTSQPLTRGASGICLAWSGFRALKDYIGKPDLFGRPFHFSQANIAAGLAASAVLAMGEGSEQTPLAIISDAPFVEFQSSDPSAGELREVNVTLEDDLFAPFWKNVPWQRGQD